MGSGAKVSTMKPNPLARDPNTKVICVYTYDADDALDCTRVRDELRALGVTWKIPYKTDAQTNAGRYAADGASRVSKRYE